MQYKRMRMRRPTSSFNPANLQLLVASLDKMRPRNAQLQVYNESALTLEKLSILKAWAEVYVVSMNNEIATYTPGPAPPCLVRNFLELSDFRFCRTISSYNLL